MEKIKLEITWSTLWRIFAFSVLIWLFYLGHEILLGLFLAIVIASGVEGLVDGLEKMGLPRSIGVILIFLVSLLLIILFLYFVLPLAIAEVNTIFSGVS